MNKTTDPSMMRIFEGGAVRNLDTDKLDYAKALSPLVMKVYLQYLAKHRQCADGSVRELNNWRKGSIPQDVYMSSLYRHMMDVWFHCEGLPEYADETLEDALSAVLFNAFGMLHEVLKDG